MFILITGPERVGKTTLARAIAAESRRLDVDVVHIGARGRVRLDPKVYLEYVRLGMRTDVLVIADRGWPDEITYSQLLDRPTEIPAESWTEWCLGAPMWTVGCGIVLAPKERRAPLESNDHTVPYMLERDFFAMYGHRRGYIVLREWEVGETTEGLIDFIAGCQAQLAAAPQLLPPAYIGSARPSVVIVDEERSHSGILAWGPATSNAFGQIARALGPWVARTTVEVVGGSKQVRQAMRNAEAVVCFNTAVGTLVNSYLQYTHEGPEGVPLPQVYALQHPINLFRPGLPWTSTCDDYIRRVVSIMGQLSNVVPERVQLLHKQLKGA
jgi:hypothetical protein